MPAFDFLYPVSLALDVAALATLLIAPLLGLVALIRSNWQQARPTFAYLGYVCCALLATSFALHLALDGGDIFMMFGFWLVPFAAVATVAMLLLAAYFAYTIVVLVVAVRRRPEWWNFSRGEA